MFLAVSCSTKKGTFLNRKYHAMTTEYNILYNGEIAFQRGLDEINEKYEDNYWEVLPIEPTLYVNIDALINCKYSPSPVPPAKVSKVTLVLPNASNCAVVIKIVFVAMSGEFANPLI